MKLIFLLLVTIGFIVQQRQIEEERWENMRLRSDLIRAEWIDKDLVDYCQGLDRLNAFKSNRGHEEVDYPRKWLRHSLLNPRQQ